MAFAARKRRSSSRYTCAAFCSGGVFAMRLNSSGPTMAFFAALIFERIILSGYCFCSMPSACMMSRTMRRESSSS